MFCLLFTGVRHPIDYKLSRTRDGHSKSFRRYVILWLLVFLLPCALVRLKLVSIEKFVPSVPSVPFYFVVVVDVAEKETRSQGNNTTNNRI